MSFIVFIFQNSEYADFLESASVGLILKNPLSLQYVMETQIKLI